MITILAIFKVNGKLFILSNKETNDNRRIELIKGIILVSLLLAFLTLCSPEGRNESEDHKFDDSMKGVKK
jgi:hypothetical protein